MLAMLLHKLTLMEIKSESSSGVRCNQEGGHCHLTNPLSLQASSSLAQGGFLRLRLLGLGGIKVKVMQRVSPSKIILVIFGVIKRCLEAWRSMSFHWAYGVNATT
jgi:hypothetical protein